MKIVGTYLGTHLTNELKIVILVFLLSMSNLICLYRYCEPIAIDRIRNRFYHAPNVEYDLKSKWLHMHTYDVWGLKVEHESCQYVK